MTTTIPGSKLSKKDIRNLFRVIDWIMDLPVELQEDFREEVHRYEQEKHMPYLSSLERMAREEGIEKGREMALEGIRLALEAKFGKIDRKVLGKVRRLSITEGRRLLDVLKTAETIADVRRMLS